MNTPEKITPEWVKDRIAYIYGIADDPEAAHSEEDSLHMAVLKAITEDRCTNPKLCALIATETSAIDFPRWTA